MSKKNTWDKNKKGTSEKKKKILMNSYEVMKTRTGTIRMEKQIVKCNIHSNQQPQLVSK